MTSELLRNRAGSTMARIRCGRSRPRRTGPLFLLIERGVAQFVGPHPVWAVIAFRLWAMLAVAMLAVAVPALAKRHGISAPKALWLAVLNPLVIMHFVAGAQRRPDGRRCRGRSVAGRGVPSHRGYLGGRGGDRGQTDRLGGASVRRRSGQA